MTMPPFGLIDSVAFEMNGFFYITPQVSRAEILRLEFKHGNVVGAPVYYSVGKKSVSFFPKADKNYTIKVRYYPPMVEA